MDWKNRLYFGDNLDILRREAQDASVDLIYLDPPFNANATCNVLFKEKSGEESAAQQSGSKCIILDAGAVCDVQREPIAMRD